MGASAVKSNIKRRIIIRTAVLSVWAAGLAYLAFFSQDTGIDGSPYLYTILALAAIWIVQLVRDLRRLRGDAHLTEAGIAQTDERNILIAYKATRLAAVICISIAPIVMGVFCFLGMPQALDTLAGALCAFAVAYLICYYVISARY